MAQNNYSSNYSSNQSNYPSNHGKPWAIEHKKLLLDELEKLHTEDKTKDPLLILTDITTSSRIFPICDNLQRTSHAIGCQLREIAYDLHLKQLNLEEISAKVKLPKEELQAHFLLKNKNALLIQQDLDRWKHFKNHHSSEKNKFYTHSILNRSTIINNKSPGTSKEIEIAAKAIFDTPNDKVSPEILPESLKKTSEESYSTLLNNLSENLKRKKPNELESSRILDNDFDNEQKNTFEDFEKETNRKFSFLLKNQNLLTKVLQETSKNLSKFTEAYMSDEDSIEILSNKTKKHKN